MTSALALIKKNVVDVVAARVDDLVSTGELHMPANYSPQNAMKAAWLTLQATEDKNHNPVLEVCSQESIANTLLDMVIQGLSPGTAKKQCYFIAFGKTLTLLRSYFGTEAILKRIYGQETEIFAQVVYEGDKFEYEINLDRVRVTKHVQVLGNIDPAKIIAAYAVITLPNREPSTEIMTMAQIKKAWLQGKANGNSPAHQGFPDQMSKRTVINRACKGLINSSDDACLIQSIDRQARLAAEEEIKEEVSELANATPIALPASKPEPIQLSEENIHELKGLAHDRGVSWGALEERVGGPIELASISFDEANELIEKMAKEL